MIRYRVSSKLGRVFAFLSISIYIALLNCNLVSAKDLIDAYQSAIFHNADYLQEVFQYESSTEDLVQKKSLFFPQVSSSATLSQNYLNFGGPLYYYQPAANFQLQQVIYDQTKFAQYTKSTQSLIFANLKLRLALQKLILNVIQSYFAVLYAYDILSTIKVSKEYFKKQLDFVKTQRFELATQVDLADAKAAYDAACVDEIRVTDDLANNKKNFFTITGTNADLIQPLEEHIMDFKLDFKSSSKESVYQNNLAIKVAHAQAKINAEDININKSGHFPTASLFFNYQYQGVPNFNLFPGNALVNQNNNILGSILSAYNVGSIMLQINIPFYSGGGISSKVREAMNMYTAAKEQLADVINQQEREMEQSLWQIDNGQNIIHAYTQALKSAKLKLSADTIAYKMDLRNSIDLTKSIKSYYNALQNYNQSRYQYLNAQVKLKYLLGQLDLESLKRINLNIQH